MFRFVTLRTISGHQVAINPNQVSAVSHINNKYHRLSMSNGEFWELAETYSLGDILTDLEAGMEIN